ncbi:ABC transporter ATP-binding protein [Thalassovita sp.]|uniref:ABC transporter ATP-binding protein n=1 Tax=Thalassovita sp. TaxID=1979401 RepID=UPI002AB15DC3|nr:ABC transporter ATP-binding protein [Thalassovita sp.]
MIDPQPTLTENATLARGLQARDLWQGYGDHTVLSGINVSLPPGKFTAILGHNGCGKSTLLKSLAGMMPVKRGSVTLEGQPIKSFATKALARQVSYLAQGAVAPEGLSVAELVAQGRYPHRKIFASWNAADTDAVERALSLTATKDLSDRPLQELSGGQRQRAWIAMTLAQEGRIVLLDEPTSFLDPAHQLEVLSLVRRLIRDEGTTVAAVLHDLNHAAQFADHIILLKAGQLLAEGSPQEVVTPDILRDAFGLDVEILRHPQTGAPICVPRMADAGGAGVTPVASPDVSPVQPRTGAQ